jgi:hypothetical protein
MSLLDAFVLSYPPLIIPEVGKGREWLLKTLQFLLINNNPCSRIFAKAKFRR